MNKVVIRLAVPEDLSICSKIINDYIDQTEWLPRVVSHENINAMFNREMLNARCFLVAEHDEVVGGYLSMDEDKGIISGLYLGKGFQCNGAGKMLLETAKERRPEGLGLTVFEPNIHAKRFYEREGFIEILEERKNETPEGVPTLMMRWNGAS